MATALVRRSLPLPPKVQTMRRYVALLIAGAALIAAACHDSVAPGESTAHMPSLSVMPSGPNVSSARANPQVEAGASTFYVRLNPKGGIVRVGAFVVMYPHDAVCDPNRSGYGPDEWKKPCPTLGRPITLRARFWTEDGVAYADFAPDIRFDPSKTVTLVTYVPDIRDLTLTDAMRSQYAINYTVSDGTTRFFVDEAIDPALATVFGTTGGKANGWAWRRIYHFSGYYVRSGRACDDSDSECSGGGELY